MKTFTSEQKAPNRNKFLQTINKYCVQCENFGFGCDGIKKDETNERCNCFEQDKG